MAEEAQREAHVPTERPQAVEATRVPQAHVDPGRAGGAAVTTPEGSGPAVGLIWRVRDQATFDQLQRRGIRRRRGPVGIVWTDDAGPGPPRVAYGVGRRTGSAPVRNRLRRRLRAIMRDLAADGLVVRGAYLVHARPEATTLPFAELAALVRAAVGSLPAPASTGAAEARP